MSLADYVIAHTVRGECRCGRCVDVGTRPDPTGHTVDMVFFVVSKEGEPKADAFRVLIAAHRGEFNDVEVFDGKEHNFLELGGWIGDQGLALQFMALGALLGVFTLLTPKTLLGDAIDDDTARMMAGAGYVAITAAKAAAA